jgi:hypothetical protein
MTISLLVPERIQVKNAMSKSWGTPRDKIESE